MANFPPLKARFLLALDDMIRRFGLDGPFLDFGAGRGDVAAHLAARYGFDGVLVEPSPECREIIARDPALVARPCYAALDDVTGRQFGLVTAFDVLEHLPDADRVLVALRRLLAPGGACAIIVPYRPRTWGWDDDYYGHLRRWSLAEFEQLLSSSGLQVLHRLDPTFPVYSLMRSAMLSTRRRPAPARAAGEATGRSALHNAWGEVPGWARWRCWDAVNRLSRLTESCMRGDELFVLAARAPGN